ncbi:MAG TPA: hypothetical protein VG502_07155 [Flexivirga sp.]|uniref:hypothetical protein n=1 Tax=Actinomycetes TaxID=1760 RepID=UPI002BB18810|nr:hypothetical protein [Flexivirga sp.]HWC22062.1 hypothetical protein [Flexivirga sp.]
MIDDLTKLLDRVSSPSDLAVVLIVGPLGFVLDAGLNVIGFLSPGYVGISAACIALGIKKSVDARLLRRDDRKALTRRQAQTRDRAVAFEDRLRAVDAPVALSRRMRDELALHERGITTDEQLEATLIECLGEYREWIRTTYDSGLSGGRR